MDETERSLPGASIGTERSLPAASIETERTMPLRPVGAEAAPLPRRRGQTHLEPQLREAGGSGTATPFVAFGDDTTSMETSRDTGRDTSTGTSTDAPDRPGPDRRPGAGTRAARFRAATTRGPREPRRRG